MKTLHRSGLVRMVLTRRGESLPDTRTPGEIALQEANQARTHAVQQIADEREAVKQRAYDDLGESLRRAQVVAGARPWAYPATI